MRSLRLYGQNDLRLAEEEQPSPTSDEILIRVTAVGICGSDLHWFEEGGIGDSELGESLVLGHEFAGVVVSGLEEGMRVAVDPAINCQTCRYCVEGNPNLCTELRFSGHNGHDGALREFVVWPRRLLHPLPASLGDVEGALLEPLGVAIHAVDLGNVTEHDSAAVFGCGPIGLLILQVLRSKGCRVVLATDVLEHRLDLAKILGAESVVRAASVDAEERIGAVESDQEADVVFEASTSNDAVEDAFRAVRPGGRVVLCGIPSDSRTSFEASTARRKELTIKLVRRMNNTYPRAIELTASGEVDLSGIVSHRFDLSEYEQAFGVAVSRAGHKVILHPTEPAE